MKDLNKLSKQIVLVIASIIVIAGCIYAGRVEYSDDILSGMSDAKYLYIKKQLGANVSDSEVISEYITHQKYYDSKEY